MEKSKAVSFRLEPAAEERKTLAPDAEFVNVIDVTEDELQEREKYGIYYDDNYNYMSHMKSRDEVSFLVHFVVRPCLALASRNPRASHHPAASGCRQHTDYHI